ncbi:MAG: hypothetical protein K2P81_08935 [Bacteriovoracaceae bacterium]|nr:hypothetical protein [Bacteriovoracaceae bacterium]
MNKRKTEAEIFEKNGRSFSHRTVYFENGKVAESGVYTCGQSDWSWTVPAGVINRYSENGEPLSVETYNEYGELDGECKYYDNKGKLLKKSIFKKDVLIEEEVFEKKEGQL